MKYLFKYFHMVIIWSFFNFVNLTPAEMLCGRVGVSDAAAKTDRGSVPSNIELSGSRATELEEEDEEEVLPFRPPRRDFESVT